MADKSLVELFNTFSESLKVLKNQTTAGEDVGTPADLPALWNHIDNCMKYVSQQSTKLSLACEKPPFPTCEEIRPVLRNIETASVNLVSACLGLSISVHGSTLKSILVVSINSVIGNLVELLGNLSESCSKKRNKYLQSTGQVWDVTDKFSSLPKNNKEAVLMKLKEVSQLLQDAHEEFDEAIKESTEDSRGKEYDVLDELNDEADDFSFRWKTVELDMATSALGIIKTSRVCLSKISKAIEHNASVEPTPTSDVRGLSTDMEELLARLSISDDKKPMADESDCCSLNFSSPVNQLDVVLSVALRISPAVDDLISSLYPPIVEVETAQNNVNKLNQLLRDFLQVAKSSHYVVPSIDDAWLCFLSNALDHNVLKTLKSLDSFNQQ